MAVFYFGQQNGRRLPSILAETRTFIGESGTAAMEGYAGSRLGRQYQLTVAHRDNGTVAILLDHHEHVSPVLGR